MARQSAHVVAAPRVTDAIGVALRQAFDQPRGDMSDGIAASLEQLYRIR